MAKRLPLLKTRYEHQMTMQTRQLLKELGFPYFAFQFEVSEQNQAQYSRWRKQPIPLRLISTLPISEARLKQFLEYCPAHCREYFTVVDNKLCVDTTFLRDQRKLKRLRRQELLDKKFSADKAATPTSVTVFSQLMLDSMLNMPSLEKPIEACLNNVKPDELSLNWAEFDVLLRALKSHPSLEQYQKAQKILESILKATQVDQELMKALDAHTVEERELAMSRIVGIMRYTGLPNAVYQVGNAGAGNLPATTNAIFGPITTDLGIAMTCAAVGIIIYNGMNLWSAPETTVEQKREYLIQQAGMMIGLPGRVAGVFAKGAPALGFAGIATGIIRFAMTEASYQLKIARLTDNLSDSKEVLIETTDKLMAEYERARNFLRSTYETLLARLGPAAQDQLQRDFSKQIQALTDHYQKMLNHAARSTAKAAMTLQADQSYRRMARVTDTVQIGLNIGASFFPPMAIGLFVSYALDISMATLGWQYVRRTAKYNQGYLHQQIVMFHDGTKISDALNKVSELNTFTVATLPLIVKPDPSKDPKSRVLNALKEMETTTQVFLQLPHRIKEPAMTKTAVLNTVGKVIANAVWMENIFLGLNQRTTRVSPEIVNMESISDSMARDITMLMLHIENQIMRLEGRVLTPRQNKQYQDLINAKMRLDKLSQMRWRQPTVIRDHQYYLNLPQAVREDYINRELDDFSVKTSRYLSFLMQVPTGKVVTNREGILTELLERREKLMSLLERLPEKYPTVKIQECEENIKSIQKELIRLRPPVMEPELKQSAELSFDQICKKEEAKLKELQSIVRAPAANEFRVVPAGVAFGILKARQIQQNTKRILSSLHDEISKAELPEDSKPIIYVQSYDPRKDENIHDHRVLKARVEGLKTEIQQLRHLLQHSPELHYADLDKAYLRYREAHQRFKSAVELVEKLNPDLSFWKRMRKNIVNALYRSSTDKELKKVDQQLELLNQDIFSQGGDTVQALQASIGHGGRRKSAKREAKVVAKTKPIKSVPDLTHAEETHSEPRSGPSLK